MSFGCGWRRADQTYRATTLTLLRWGGGAEGDGFVPGEMLFLGGWSEA